jgi:hypothetical protein
MPDRHLWQRHSTKTITFTGAAGLGAVGTVTVFTCTGRSIIHAITAFCTEDLVGNLATIELGTATTSNDFVVQTTAEGIDVNKWWGDATPSAGSILIKIPATGADGIGAAQSFKTISSDIIATIATADVTDGTIVFDVIYTPLTDGARLV